MNKLLPFHPFFTPFNYSAHVVLYQEYNNDKLRHVPKCNRTYPFVYKKVIASSSITAFVFKQTNEIPSLELYHEDNTTIKCIYLSLQNAFDS